MQRYEKNYKLQFTILRFYFYSIFQFFSKKMTIFFKEIIENFIENY
jgi:hypothetical protein